jgi:hypothetical protein
VRLPSVHSGVWIAGERAAPAAGPATARVLRFVAFSSLLGCTAVDTPPVAFETENVTLYSHDPVQRGQAEWVQSAFEVLSAKVGLRGTAGRIELVELDAEDVATQCDHPGDPSSVGLLGCTEDTRAYANTDYYPHEIVHAILNLAYDPPKWLDEGLAVLLDQGVASVLTAVRAVEPDAGFREWLDDRHWSAQPWAEQRARYEAAASFVAFLVERGGWERLVHLLEQLASEMDVGARDEVLRAVYGSDSETLLAEWVAIGTRAKLSMRRMEVVCGVAPPLAASPAVLRLASGPRVTPGLAGDFYASGALGVAEPSRLALRVLARAEGSPEYSVEVYRCDEPLAGRQLVSFRATPAAAEFQLEPGSYVVVAHVNASAVGPSDASAEVELPLEWELAPLDAGSCGEFVVDVDGLSTLRLYPAFAATWTACTDCEWRYRLVSSAARTATLYPGSGLRRGAPDGPFAIEPRLGPTDLCNGGCSSADCRRVHESGLEPIDLSVGSPEGATLIVRPGGSPLELDPLLVFSDP